MYASFIVTDLHDVTSNTPVALFKFCVPISDLYKFISALSKEKCEAMSRLFMAS